MIRRDGWIFAGAERHDERRALIDAWARDFNLAAVQPDEIVDDRQPQPETTVPARGRTVRLAKSVEDVRKKGGIDADPAIGDRNADAPINLLSADRDSSVIRRELDGVRQQIPQDLLQARRVGEDIRVVQAP